MVSQMEQKPYGQLHSGQAMFHIWQYWSHEEECLTVHGYPSLGFGTERQAMGAAPFLRPQQPSRQPFNTTRPALIQSSAQQPRA